MARRAAHPLAYARLWDQPAPRTSQRRSLALAPGSVALALLGGNGSGKSVGAIQLSVAAALGGDHPDARAWLDANGLPAEVLPPYPGRVLVSALTGNDSRRVLREKVKHYTPLGGTWRNETGDGEAEWRAPRGRGGRQDNGGVIVMKSNDQGRRTFQGDEFDLIVLDEEHDSDVFAECLARLGRRQWKGGYILLSMTPLKGMTWVYDDFIAQPKAGYRAVQIHGADNPYLDQGRRAQILASFGEHERAARERGEFRALEGRVYGAWDRNIHVVPAFDVPKEWRRYAGIDFGTSNPFAMVLGALDPADDVLHIIAVYYRANLQWRDHALALRAIFDQHGWPEVVWADPEEANGRMTLAEHGIPSSAARKDVRPGINAMATRLQPDPNGTPHLVVHDAVSGPFVREIEGYTWAPRTGDRDAPDMPLKANDHCMDSCRYLIFGLERSSSFGASF